LPFHVNLANTQTKNTTMKYIIAAAIIFCGSLAGNLQAANAPAPESDSAKAEERLPGVDFAQGITEITGVAVSPLLGVSGVGAWRYFNTPEHLRSSLPWFCNPYVWGFGLCVLSLCFLKDVVGVAVPSIIKKPFDMAELIEDKLSALVASTAFVPLIAHEMSTTFAAAPQAAYSGGSHLLLATAMPLATAGFDFRFLFIPLGMAAFIVVWMTSHAINVLIVLSPFGFIDAILKAIKMFLMGIVVVSYIINPYLGAAVSLFFIAIAAYLAPTVFRFSFFGTMLAKDFVLPWMAKGSTTPECAHAFIAHKSLGVPVRTFGKVTVSADGQVIFSYRPCFVFNAKTVILPSENLSLGKGVLYPTLMRSNEANTSHIKLVMFLPRYRSHELKIAEHYGITNIHDSSLAKGFKAVKAWIKEVISSGSQKIEDLTKENSPTSPST